MGPRAQPVYRFESFRLDLAQGLLSRDGEAVPLTQKALQVLAVLVENRGRLVEKEELLRLVWPETFVQEATLAQNIFTLRHKLGQKQGGTQFIETVPKRGYRFAAPVTVGEPQIRAKEQARGAMGRQFAGRTVPRWWVAAAGVLVLIVLGAYVLRHEASSAAPHPMRLAVLPMDNLTGDPQQEYLSDGLTEGLIADLGRLEPRQLGVIARTSSMAYKNTRKTVAQIGKELGVSYVLESSLRETGQKMRVTAQLIRVEDQTEIWGQSYERDAANYLVLQTEISTAVARSVRLKLTDATRMRLASADVTNREAYAAYLKGRYYWNTRTREGLEKSIEYYDEALRINPASARAYAGLADAYNMLAFYGYSSDRETLNKARVAAEKAVELDASLPEGHAAQAYGNFMWWFEWPEAERGFLDALQLNANYLPARHWYALYLAAMGRKKESLEQIQRAEEIDPLSPITRTASGYIAYLARENDLALRKCNAALKINPDFAVAHYVAGLALQAKGNSAQAISELQKAVALSGNRSPTYLAALGNACAIAGRRKEAQALLAELDDRARQGYVAATAQALIYVGLGDREKAVAWLQRAEQTNDSNAIWARVDPRWDSLRSDPWFQAWLARTFPDN